MPEYYSRYAKFIDEDSVHFVFVNNIFFNVMQLFGTN
jgi:hypothetical protein